MRIRSLSKYLAGEPLAVVNGRPVWMIRGAADDDGTDDGGTGDVGKDDSDDSDDDSDDSSKDDAGGEGNVGPAVTREEYERLKARMQAADRRATSAENKVKDFEDKDKTELERAQTALAEAQKERDAALEDLKNAQLENAFHAHTKFDWHDPEVAFKMLDMTDVQIGDDGKVTGMAEAIAALAKSKKFLVSDEREVAPASVATGSTHNGRRKGGNDDAATADRKRRFPSVYR